MLLSCLAKFMTSAEMNECLLASAHAQPTATSESQACALQGNSDADQSMAARLKTHLSDADKEAIAEARKQEAAWEALLRFGDDLTLQQRASLGFDDEVRVQLAKLASAKEAMSFQAKTVFNLPHPGAGN